MYIFAEPVTEEQADEIQSVGNDAQQDFARNVVGVGKDNPEVQAAWQDIQGEVDEQVDEDGEPIPTTDNQETGSKQEEVATDAVQDISEEAPEPTTKDVTSDTKSDGPLMGWTLTVRSKVNGGYVDRPVKFNKHDDWKVEYHIQEIPTDSRWRLYNALKERRRGLIGMEEQEVDKGLQHYRDQIQRFSNRGREWRKKQDELNEELGVQIYRPMGPGSETTASDIPSPATEDEVPDLPKPPAGEEAMKDLPEPPAVEEDLEKLPQVPS
jgi:hypothetical protein